LSLQDLLYALDQARFYLRRDIDTNATTLYRLFHEGLAESLRIDPYGLPREGAAPTSTSGGTPYARTVYEGLLQSVPPAEGGRHAWHVADPYLLRHAAQHARNADTVDELLQDPEYLVYGEPEMVNAVLANARSRPGRLAAAVYRVSYQVVQNLRPEQRRQILALNAARLQVTELSGELARWADWHPVWATGEKISARRTATLSSHTDRVTGVATTTLDGRPVAITASLDRTARVWDLATGQAIATFTGHTNRVEGVATTTLDGRPVAITTGWGPTALVWDLSTGQATTTLTGHTSIVKGVDTAIVDGRPVAITTGLDGTALVWDLATRRAAATLTGHAQAVTGVATTILDGRPVGITTGWDPTARVWDLSTGQAIATFTGHTSMATGVATTILDGRPVGITTSYDRTARVWDLATGQGTATLTGHTYAVTGVATTILDGCPVAITTSYDRTARVWDLANASCQAVLVFPEVLNCVSIAANRTVVLGMGHVVIALDLAPFSGRIA
jgi:hypothetical protein